MSLQALIDKRTEAVKFMRDMLDAADGENRGLNAEEQQKWDEMSDTVTDFDARIERHNSVTQFEETQLPDGSIVIGKNAPISTGDNASGGGDTSRNQETYDVAFEAFLRGGMGGLNAEQRNVLMSRRDVDVEKRAQSVGTTTAGGFTVPEGFQSELDEAMLAVGQMGQVIRILNTASGQDIPWPTMDDTSNVGELLGENTQAAEQDVTFGSKTLNAYMYSSKIVRVSLQLLQDSAFNLNVDLPRWLGTRIGRIVNLHRTTGTGSSQPQGIVTGSAQGKVGTTGQTTSIIYDDLVDLEHSVDPDYRRDASFMMADSSLKVIKKLKDGDSRPLWLPGLVSGDPNTILGYGYAINQDVPAMAANAKSVLFGDMQKYIGRNVTGAAVMRLTERYADYLQVGFLAFSRHDGKLIDAGTNPIKHYANSAT